MSITTISEYYSPSTKEHVIADALTPVAVECSWVSAHVDAINLIVGEPMNELLPEPVRLR